MFIKSNEKKNKGLIEKNKKYSYGELKTIFEELEVDIVLHPLGDDENVKVSDVKGEIMKSLMTIPIICGIKEKLFGKEG